MSIPMDTRRLSPPDTPLLPSSPIYVCVALYTPNQAHVLDTIIEGYMK